jgi:GAF domain-containing protein
VSPTRRADTHSRCWEQLGHIGLNDGMPDREWTAAEIEPLLALATLFGVTIERGRQIQKLADAARMAPRAKPAHDKSCASVRESLL